jgi:hypothetical protein
LGDILQEIPARLCAKLIALDDKGLEAVAKAWAQIMSTPEHTHSVTGKRISEDWTTNDALSLVQPIAALAQHTIGGKGMYLLIEA